VAAPDILPPRARPPQSRSITGALVRIWSGRPAHGSHASATRPRPQLAPRSHERNAASPADQLAMRRPEPPAAAKIKSRPPCVIRKSEGGRVAVAIQVPATSPAEQTIRRRNHMLAPGSLPPQQLLTTRLNTLHVVSASQEQRSRSGLSARQQTSPASRHPIDNVEYFVS